MKISIEPQKFLDVLLHNGMGESEAKALLYDLIMESNGVSTAKPAPIVRAPVEHEESTEQTGIEADADSEGNDFEFENIQKAGPKLRKPVRMNFSSFGGTEDPR